MILKRAMEVMLKSMNVADKIWQYHFRASGRILMKKLFCRGTAEKKAWREEEEDELRVLFQEFQRDQPEEGQFTSVK